MTSSSERSRTAEEIQAVITAGAEVIPAGVLEGRATYVLSDLRAWVDRQGSPIDLDEAIREVDRRRVAYAPNASLPTSKSTAAAWHFLNEVQRRLTEL